MHTMRTTKTRAGLLFAATALVMAGLVLGAGAYPAQAQSKVILYDSGIAGNSYSNYATNGFDGGEFEARIIQWQDSTPVTSVKTYYQNHGGSYGPTQFATFCLQTNQVFYPGSQYYVDIADATDHKAADIKPLAESVKRLFHRWNAHQLDGYDYDDLGTSVQSRRNSAQKLQNLIWYLQSGGAVGSYNAGDATVRDWYTDATTLAGQTGSTRVRVMRLYSGWPPRDDGTMDGQDQLIEVATPEPTTVALLAIGALPVLPLIRRRRSA